MNRAFVQLALALILSAPAHLLAAGGIVPLAADPDLRDTASLQRGARYYMNFCSGCHGIKFMRYNRIGADLGISDDLLRENLLFTADSVVDQVVTAMNPSDAEGWFGVVPPDLSVIARSRGPNWLYSYLVTFYEDPNPSRPFGVNNVVFPEVSMPHVMWPLQGRQVLTKAERPEHVVAEHPRALEVAGDAIRIAIDLEVRNGGEVEHLHIADRLEVLEAGTMSPGEFRRAARDVTNFLTYVGEPAKLVRYQMGIWVLAFLAVMFFLSRALYKEYWRDVH